MSITNIDKNMKAVQVLAAEARGERIDSVDRENLDNIVKD